MIELEKKIEKAIMVYPEEKFPKPNRYWIKELTYCLRKAYYNRTLNPAREFNNYIFGGIMFHELFPKITKDIDEFKDAKWEERCEKDCGDFVISGKTDITTEDTAYELKYSASKLVSGECPEQYSLQVQPYGAILGKPNVGIIIVNSRFLKTTIFKMKTDKHVLDTLVERGKILHTALKDKTPPVGPEYHWECSFCNWKKNCLSLLVEASKKAKEEMKWKK